MEEQRKTYKQLRPEERMVIASMKLQGASKRSLDATKWNRGSASGILCARSCLNRQDSEPRKPKPRSEGCLKTWRCNASGAFRDTQPGNHPAFANRCRKAARTSAP